MSPPEEQTQQQQHKLNRPDHWGSRSTAPYYRSKFAFQLQKVIDEMMAEYKEGKKDARIYKYKEFPGRSPITLYNMINQAFHYICDRLDEDGRYRRFKEITQIKRDKGVGVRIAYGTDLSLSDSTPSLARAEKVRLRDLNIEESIQEFLEDDSRLKFEATGLVLTPIEIEYLQSTWAGIKSIIAQINSERIVLIKVSEEELAKLNDPRTTT